MLNLYPPRRLKVFASFTMTDEAIAPPSWMMASCIITVAVMIYSRMTQRTSDTTPGTQYD